MVIGDSMVKHIDRQKIERAAGCQSVVHSYSGARVEQINSKIKEYWSEGEQYDTVVLHVGTNNLVSEDPEKVAAKMDELIENLKDHAKKIAVSSVIKRYDNRVPASNITHFNNLVNNLCSYCNITFLNSFDTNQSHRSREIDGAKFHIFGSVHAMKTEIPPFDSEIKDQLVPNDSDSHY